MAPLKWGDQTAADFRRPGTRAGDLVAEAVADLAAIRVRKAKDPILAAAAGRRWPATDSTR
jgi:hypothetical protein